MKCITINQFKNKNQNKKGDFPMVESTIIFIIF